MEAYRKTLLEFLVGQEKRFLEKISFLVYML